MAGFKTHITTSSLLGVGLGATALTVYDAPLPACILAGGLCGVSGMLPDLDSASGVPKRESIAFAAAVVPLLMAERFKRMGMPAEYIVLLGGFMYLFIRFGVAKILTRFTVHRGMFHSLPACLIAGELAFLISGHENVWQRYFNGGAVMLGFMSHLVLDEIWALDFRGGRHSLQKLVRHRDEVLGRVDGIQRVDVRRPDDADVPVAGGSGGHEPTRAADHAASGRSTGRPGDEITALRPIPVEQGDAPLPCSAKARRRGLNAG